MSRIFSFFYICVHVRVPCLPLSSGLFSGPVRILGVLLGTHSLYTDSPPLRGEEDSLH